MSYDSLTVGIITALKANAGLSALVGTRVYTDVPDNATYPYLSVNYTRIANDTKSDNGYEYTFLISAWSNKTSPQEVEQINDAIYAALHHQNAVFSGYGVYDIMLQTSGFMKDSDGKTWHGINQFTINTGE